MMGSPVKTIIKPAIKHLMSEKHPIAISKRPIDENAHNGHPLRDVSAKVLKIAPLSTLKGKSATGTSMSEYHLPGSPDSLYFLYLLRF